MMPFFRRHGPGILLIAITYFYFLIFAQFAFVELCRADHPDSLKLMMGAMALFGIAGSLATPVLMGRFRWEWLLSVGMSGCSLAAFLSVPAKGLLFYLVISSCVGVCLGVLTVTLTARLNSLLSQRGWGISVGLGTGIAYAAANFPFVFSASSSTQALIAAGVILAGVPLVMRFRGDSAENPGDDRGSVRFGLFYAVLVFLALVWLDSAAFYIIQHTAELKKQSWGDGYLWRNAGLHFSVAVLAGFLLQRRALSLVVTASFGVLALASLCLNQNHAGLAVTGGWLYPAGVSLYSTALVAAPAFLVRFGSRAWSAAILYSVAGWFGSANGIGMAESLERIPEVFLWVAGVLFVLPWCGALLRRKRRELLLIPLVVGLGFIGSRFLEDPSQSKASSIARGRQVYLSEGCIHCHSRYVRPDSRDVELWGPVVSLEEILKEQPVLIGNRRQGPDLLNVGNRRSRDWLKQHFLDPRSLVSGSSMPSYSHLFGDDEQRGEDLIDFLMVRGIETIGERLQDIRDWEPNFTGPLPDGETLFLQHCAACHGPSGKGNGLLAGQWSRPPANLVEGPFLYSKDGNANNVLARLIKFGIPGTDMPGHETLSDNKILGLTRYLEAIREK